MTSRRTDSSDTIDLSTRAVSASGTSGTRGKRSGRAAPAATKRVERSQRGGFAIGLIVGLLIGLTLALGVALYVTKVPIPFVNKVPQRTADQDAAEAEKNRHWDPNGPLSGKNPAKPNASASGTVSAPPVVVAPPPPVPDTAPTVPETTATAPRAAASGVRSAASAASQPTARASAPRSSRDPAAILADRPGAGSAPRTLSTTGGGDPFTYFVQAGAYGRTEDAEQQRAKLAMMGLEGRMTEREQAGRTVYRVRVGPYERREDAESAKQRLESAGVEAALVRVQR